MDFVLDFLRLASMLVALAACCAFLAWAFSKHSRKDMTLRHPVSVSIGQCIAMFLLGGASTLLFSAWVGQPFVTAVLLIMLVVCWGVGMGFEIFRRNGGHKTDGAPGDDASEPKAS